MDMSRTERDELLAGLALEALGDEHERGLAETVGVDDEAASVLADMRQVVAMLGEADATRPPPSLFESILAVVSEMPPATLVAPAPPVAVYRRMVELMSQRLAELSAEVCTRRADPYEWTIQGLIGHLTSIERYTAAKLGLVEFDYPEDREMDHLGLGEHVIEQELGRTPEETFAAWRSAADVVLAHGETLSGDDLEREVPFHGFPTRVATLFVLRGFEIWTHVEDVSRAGDLDPVIPEPADLRAMSQTSVRIARWVLGMTGAESGDAMLHVVLTGDGGGVFPVRFGTGQGNTTTVVTDVVDYCRMAAQRLAPERLQAQVDGNPDLVESFFRAAATIAV